MDQVASKLDDGGTKHRVYEAKILNDNFNGQAGIKFMFNEVNKAGAMVLTDKMIDGQKSDHIHISSDGDIDTSDPAEVIKELANRNLVNGFSNDDQDKKNVKERLEGLGYL